MAQVSLRKVFKTYGHDAPAVNGIDLEHLTEARATEKPNVARIDPALQVAPNTLLPLGADLNHMHLIDETTGASSEPLLPTPSAGRATRSRRP